uniref:Uncharacterized protein n=1 Tax=Pithovirus LCPAC304 TaxID=2506594 RepID=A0A481Z861_9VIRU|nr:MAG: hypothetical protein LCPAC304_04450 [Pithovirus LCPAC304]
MIEAKASDWSTIPTKEVMRMLRLHEQFHKDLRQENKKSDLATASFSKKEMARIFKEVTTVYFGY